MRYQAEDVDYIGFTDRAAFVVAAAEGDHLVEDRLGVAHAAFRRSRDDSEGIVVDENLLGHGNIAQALNDQWYRDSFQVEALTTRQNCWQYLVRLCRGEKELHMRRRFLESFEQGIPGLRRQHVDFVDYIDLVLPAIGRRVLHVVADLPHVLDAVVRGAVDFQHIKAATAGNFMAGRAFTARFRAAVGVLCGLFAVQCFGKNAGTGCLADSPGANEQVSVAYP